MANPYQQLKREVAGVLGEPVAWVCRGRTTRHPVLRLVPWRSAPVLLALTPTHVAVFLRTGAALPLATPSCERVPLSRVRAVGLRHVRAVDARGRVHWFRLDAREPTARGFLTAPRTFRVR